MPAILAGGFSVLSLPGSSRLWGLLSRFPRLKTAKLRRLPRIKSSPKYKLISYSSVFHCIRVRAPGVVWDYSKPKQKVKNINRKPHCKILTIPGLLLKVAF